MAVSTSISVGSSPFDACSAVAAACWLAVIAAAASLVADARTALDAAAAPEGLDGVCVWGLSCAGGCCCGCDVTGWLRLL